MWTFNRPAKPGMKRRKMLEDNPNPTTTLCATPAGNCDHGRHNGGSFHDKADGGRLQPLMPGPETSGTIRERSTTRQGRPSSRQRQNMSRCLGKVMIRQQSTNKPQESLQKGFLVRQGGMGGGVLLEIGNPLSLMATNKEGR